ncbi:legume-like lectin [Amylocystis lapponica]|nr:legume-like lectin [Amylocystis lapponica]
MLFNALLLCLWLLPLGVTALESQVANRTIDRTVNLRTHSVYAPYIDQDLQNRWWDFGADTYVNTNKHIRLTRARPSQMGWLWSRVPLTASNWIVEVEFKVSGETSHLYGDGLAIWLTTTRAQPGPVFGSVDNFQGLGVFLDTYANSRHSYSFPRVVGMLGDGSTSYDQPHDGENTNIGACSANYRRTNVATKLKITYLKDTYLNVQVQYKAWDEWTDCFTVQGISLPSAPYLGFSAMTGDVSDNHDIISVSTYSAILSSPDAQRNKLGGSTPARLRRISGAPSWTWTLLKIVLGLLAVAGLLYAYKTWVLTQASGRRFGNFVMGRRASLGGAMYGDAKRF